jgi:predicted  nucleic acid-binding Zn-ribbon protein
MDKIADLLKRVQSLETRADKSDRSLASHAENLADHERRIKALESMGAASNVTVSGEIDTNAILKQVNLIRQEFVNFKEVKYVSDLESLRLELRGYTDKETLNLKNMLSKKITDGIDSLKYELDRLRAEYENFKNRDFKDLEARVTALEKKLQRLESAFSNFKIPDASGGGISEEAFR